MTILFRFIRAAAVAWATFGQTANAADEPGPLLRQSNYLAILPAASGQSGVILKSHQYSPAYSDLLHYNLIGPGSVTVTTGEVAPGAELRLAIPSSSDGLHVLELDSGWNACRADTDAAPSAWVAREPLPLHTARGVKWLFFYVPKGVKQFSLWLVAATPREGARVRITGPDGRIAVEEEGDYDTPQRARVRVPSGMDGKVWSLSLLKPQSASLGIDDVKLWLDSALPPYLSKREDWALLFGKRKHP